MAIDVVGIVWYTLNVSKKCLYIGFVRTNYGHQVDSGYSLVIQISDFGKRYYVKFILHHHKYVI